MGLLIEEASPLLNEDEEVIRGEVHKMVTVEVLPLPILSLAAHKLRQVPDPRPSVLSTYEVNGWTTIPIPHPIR